MASVSWAKTLKSRLKRRLMLHGFGAIHPAYPPGASSSIGPPFVDNLYDALLRVEMDCCLLGPAKINPNALNRLLTQFTVNSFSGRCKPNLNVIS